MPRYKGPPKAKDRAHTYSLRLTETERADLQVIADHEDVMVSVVLRRLVTAAIAEFKTRQPRLDLSV